MREIKLLVQAEIFTVKRKKKKSKSILARISCSLKISYRFVKSWQNFECFQLKENLSPRLLRRALVSTRELHTLTLKSL